MQETIASFSTIMTWLVLFLCLVVVVLLGLAAWHLPAHRRRAHGAGGARDRHQLVPALAESAELESTALASRSPAAPALSVPPVLPATGSRLSSPSATAGAPPPADAGCSPGGRWAGAARPALPVKRTSGSLSCVPGALLRLPGFCLAAHRAISWAADCLRPALPREVATAQWEQLVGVAAQKRT
jgi:hypothetical protein